MPPVLLKENGHPIFVNSSNVLYHRPSPISKGTQIIIIGQEPLYVDESANTVAAALTRAEKCPSPYAVAEEG